MFVNISNHPSSKWPQAQFQAAIEKGGPIRDIPFPNVPPTASTEDVRAMANTLASKINPGDIVMVQGEFSLTFELSRQLVAKGSQVVVACSERRSIEQPNPDGSVTKTAVFDFCQFRAL